MAALELQPLAADRIDDAAALLADRHAAHRAAETLLPEIEDFRPYVEAELEREDASGMVAYRGGEAVGYLVGRVEPDLRLGDSCATVDLAGFAAREPEVARDLYASLAQGWIDAGAHRHLVMVPALRELIDPWVRLAFGIQFATAVRETRPEPPVDARVSLRPGGPDDLKAVAQLDRILWELQTRAPSFSRVNVDGTDFEAEWADLWDDPQLFPYHVVAECDGHAVGHALLYQRPTGDLRVPEHNVDLAHAATLDEVRGSGVGLALTADVLRWAYDNGYRSMTTDWRMVNLLSSRFWPRRGFRPTYYRMYRAVI